MDCHEVQEQMLESFAGVPTARVSAAVEAHVSECAVCARFLRIQETLDRHLSATFLPPALSPAFRAGLHQRLHHQPGPLPSDTLFERVHFASFAIVTMALSAYLPFDPWVVLSFGAATALSSYVVFAVIRDVFEGDRLNTYA